MIYAVHVLDEAFVKIGFSDGDLEKRIAALQTGNPFEITQLFCVPGSLLQEQNLHALLRMAFGRVRIPMPPNEWYPGRNPFFQAFLAEMRFGANRGASFLSQYQSSVKRPGKRGETAPNIRWPAAPPPSHGKPPASSRHRETVA